MLFRSVAPFIATGSSDSAILHGPFKPWAGHAYKVPKIIPYSKYNSNDYSRSTVHLYEDDKLLGSVGSSFSDIITLGGGRFTSWQSSMMNDIYFSSSDGTDPNTNGRTYRVFDPEAADPYLPSKIAPGVVAYNRVP